eukprot:scaffold22575_cov141-Cylindrotheca_fusiformis.AAC.45
MGTVINVGSDRFAEIEAMAAMVEANPEILEVHQEEVDEYPVNTLGDKASLALPILEAKSFDEPTVLPQSKRPPQRSPSQDLKMKTTADTNDSATTTPSINHQQYTNNPTTSAMVSAAIRRIGSGRTSNKTVSAPPTPKTPGAPVPRVEDFLKSTLTPGRKPRSNGGTTRAAPLSFALRSPGSSARFNLQKERVAPSTPDFSRTPRSDSASHSLWQSRTPRSDSASHSHWQQSRTPRSDSASHSLWHQTKPKTPISPSIMLPGLKFAQKCFSFDQTLDEYPFPVAEDGNDDDILRELPRSSRYNLSYRPLQQSQSWDVGLGKHSDAAFRARSNAFGTFRRTASHDDESLLRERLNSDNFSPTKFSKAPALELQNSQRIETEREDALDILACLVERGAEQQQEERDLPASGESESLITNVSEELQKWKNEQDNSDENFSIRIAVLEELLRSHAYAGEMKRAAHSASTWLKSIGRSTTSAVDLKEVKVEDSDEAQEGAGEGKTEEDGRGDDNDSSLKMEMATLKAMLHTAQMELKEKAEANQKLDMELSKCRAEIGRLRSASRSEALHLTASRSMFDESHTDDEPSRSKSKINTGNDDSMEVSRVLDDSFNPNNSIFQGLEDDKNYEHGEPDQSESLALREALEKANETIRQLHEELHGDAGDDDREAAPVVDVSGTTDKKTPSKHGTSTSSSSQDSRDHQTINVRMLDGENFVTEWTELTPPLPPPPDHGLRSPIVNVVFEQWTGDRSLHESLLAWMDRVMTGNDLESSVPPLTISSLDHQVRDGFVMHVLPLLLRRADIHVDVQTRAHRRTSYDIAVTVTQKAAASNNAVHYQKPTQALLDQQHQIDEWAENFEPHSDSKSVAHSAVTDHINNSNQYYTGSYDRNDNQVEEYSSFAGMTPPAESDDLDQKQEAGIMSALGGALGGLLSRRKVPANAASPSREMVSPIREAASLEENDEPYHRVVSAPPGRIGVTFVEYRGHAMVSDVAPDSPLSSWVYPSDILIAIDEIPVSGMRVRDIVRVLTNRRDSQRALRVISSHAMNEFTLNASAINEPT